ncbi:unnamed protein product, partial [Allacma fusca]
MPRRSLPAILDGNFFRIVKEEANGHVTAQCITCEQELQDGISQGVKRDSTGGIRKGSLASTTNVLKHLKKEPNNTQTSDPGFKKIFYSSMAKCSGFWNKVSRSKVIAEQLQLICGKAIQNPCPTRWNSLYDCITSLLVHREKFEQIFEAAGISTPSREEIEVLEDYVTCMNPIATALDKLQGEERFLYGYFAPIIITTSKNLVTIIETFGSKRHVKIMAEILKARLEKRFPHVFQIDYNRSTFELLSFVCHFLSSVGFLKSERMQQKQRLFLRPNDVSHSKEQFRKILQTMIKLMIFYIRQSVW